MSMAFCFGCLVGVLLESWSTVTAGVAAICLVGVWSPVRGPALRFRCVAAVGVGLITDGLAWSSEGLTRPSPFCPWYVGAE